jgi:peptide chain release factor subunit 1
MTELDRALLRTLADWDTGTLPVVSVYLDVDGRRYPRPQDYEQRLDPLLHPVREAFEAAVDREARLSLNGDAHGIDDFVRTRFVRGSTRGLAVFSCSRARLWEVVELPRDVRDQIEVGPIPDVRQLEALAERFERVCTVLVDGTSARIFFSGLGRIEEDPDVLVDDVPGRHEQGGWSQGRYQRHIGEHRKGHLKHVAEALFGRFQERPFDHLVLGGPDEAVAELEGHLHDYLRQRIRARLHLPVKTTSAAEVLERTVELEDRMEREEERAVVDEVVAQVSAGRNAVAGLRPVLRALADARVARLVVAIDVRAAGTSCPSCGRLAEANGGRCETCGAEVADVPDVVEAAVAQAFRQGADVQIVEEDGELHRLGGVGAILRF